MGNTMRVVFFILTAAPLLLAQSESPKSPDGLTILRTMSEHYAQAKSWHIEATQEETASNEFSHRSQKTVMAGAIFGNQYHFEGHSFAGSALHISDGKTAWDLHPEEHAYVRKPAPTNGYQPPRVIQMNEMAAQQATDLQKDFAGFASHYTGAARMPDETITIDGNSIPCYVVHIAPEQRRGPITPGYGIEETLWIEKATWAVRKTDQQGRTFFIAGAARIPEQMKTVVTYTTASLNGPVSESLFQFTPPQDAKLVPKFADNPYATPDLAGQPAPEVQLVAADGKRVPLSSYRGKPVLLDFWATWCLPCTQLLPRLAELEKDATPKGLVLLSIDEDDDVKTATAYLAQHHYTWPNTQDDGKIGDAFNKTGIPLYVLIDAQGKIAWSGMGVAESDLRKAVAGLGPQFASLAPSSKPQPCETAAR